MRAGLTLQARMYALLLVNSLIPLLLAWLFINFAAVRTHERQLDLMIGSEIEKNGAVFRQLMDSMKNISQQIIADREIRQQLRNYLDGSRFEIQYVNERIAVFEGSNPSVSGITFFRCPPLTGGGGGGLKLNNSLISEGPAGEHLLFSRQNELKYYGPHETFSVAGRYPVISLARAMPYLDVLLYMESGYKLLDITPSESLRAMGAVILAAADSGEYMYASDEAFLQTAGFSKTGGAGEAAGYRTYRYTDTRGWSLCAYIPQSAFRREAFRLSFGFFIIALTALALSVFLSAFIWRSVRRPLALFEKNLKHLILDEDDSGLYSVRLREFDQYVEHFVMLKKRIVELLEEARQQERARSSLELKLLMHKINPHFIYNTLNTLKWYSAAHGYPDMDGFISSLNRLLVYNMEKNGEATLQSEMDSIDDYICLQKLKYDIAYTRKISVPDSMRSSRTPRFILYPLVENAILHGLQGNGAVEVCASLAEDGGIAVRVFDSGGSLDDGAITRIMEQARDSSGRGIGLRYVCQTLETMFPGESSFSIRREGGGTVCEIRMPYCVGAVYAKNGSH